MYPSRVSLEHQHNFCLMLEKNTVPVLSNILVKLLLRRNIIPMLIQLNLINLIRHGHLQNHKHALNPTADAFHKTKYTKLRACCFFGIVPNFVFNISPFMTEQNKSMDWFLYDKGLRHEKVKHI